tara:strand:- start:823 stop:1287 length:465 start_codon:yes stop_codon:yes gene_type:complete
MSDEQDNNDGLPNNESMQAEWSRVMSNPDNLIVSDVLRSSLPDEFSSSENVSSILELAVEIGGLEVSAPLTRLDIAKDAWLCQMSVDASDAAVILSFSLDEIQESTIQLQDKGNTIKSFELGQEDNLSLSVDTDGRVYYVTLSCQRTPKLGDEQ